MVSLWTIFAVFLILIGVNICIYIGKKAYRTHILLKNTVSYILLQYGVGVLVVYLVYLEVMSLFGVDARPSITRELVLWSVLTLTTASVSYVVSRLALVPADGMLYHIHNVLLHRLMDGTRPEAWRTTMRQFEIELSKATKSQVYGHMLPKFLQYNSSGGDVRMQRSGGGINMNRSHGTTSDVVRRHLTASEDMLRRATSEASMRSWSSLSIVEKINSKVALLKPLSYALYETAAATLPVVLAAVATAMKHWWIRLSGMRVSLGSVDEYYKAMNVDKRARIPNHRGGRLPPLMMKTAAANKNQLNFSDDDFCTANSDTSEASFQ